MTLSPSEAVQWLAALAAGLCQDAQVAVEVRRDSGWRWDPVRRVITVDERDLEEEGPEYCAGILAHEVGHFFISRYPHFGSVRSGSSVVRLVLNGIEDPRVEGWIRRRYPGCGAWLDVSNAEVRPLEDGTPLVLQFCLGCAVEGARGWAPADERWHLSAEVGEALGETREARRRYAETVPAPDLDHREDRLDLAARYRSRVWPRLVPELKRYLPGEREQLVRTEATEALDIAEAEIIPRALELMEEDTRRLGEALGGDDDLRTRARRAIAEGSAEFAREILSEIGTEIGTDGRRADGSSPRGRRLAQRLLELFLEEVAGGRVAVAPGAGGRPVLGSPLMASGDPASGGVLPAGHQPVEAPPPPQSPLTLSSAGEYDRALDRLGDQIDLLTGRLADILRPRRRMGRRSGYPSGSRVDLRRLMQFEADPRRYRELWIRSSLAERRDAAVLLLVDLSGSMAGEKVDAAMLGTILTAETLERLSVTYAVVGFQDVPISFVGFEDPLDEAARTALAEMPLEVSGHRPDGHNMPSWNDDGPCLGAAGRMLAERPEQDQILIAVSDGLPEGRRSGAADLERAIRDLSAAPADLQLIGVGLGPGTRHVERFYPESLAEVPVSRFADAIGELVERVVASPRTREQARSG